ncbi:60S ribosomal protein L13a-4-like isoform X2 [Prunus yedoensis var. nudiflora]|uniref:60S ribosomal protein L13a-4-like isoform X2 n=1 Tax=Prunus yedoensis var. nudiflora TaxID=2094558 RepID=A0A314YK86_PRUYE|nr:60S ribosomal protein L13a-4-like isoform X2 [Prunus yedoensis var. nudiflora]
MGLQNDSSQDQAWVCRMIPHKTKHGFAAALARLKAYEGVPDALKYSSVAVQELENKRKKRAQLAYERKKQLNKLRVKAEKKPRCICLICVQNVVED